jgi:3-hydroxyisobutyrate dehydrogenase
MITILGTGLLGSGFARALEADGAVACADPAEAARGATRVHIVVSDDAAVDSVLAAAAPGFAPGTRVFDHTTTSTRGALERTRAWPARGVTYLHAPVFMGPQQATESTGLMLISGDRAVVEAATPVLAPMTGKLIDLGPRVDQAAAFKLLGNLFLMTIGAGFVDMLALAKAMGVSPDDAGTLFQHFNPGASLGARFKRMTDGDYDHPSWELAMARKDARLMQAEVDAVGLPLTTLPGLASRMDELIAEGHGHADWTVIAKDFIPRR